MTTTEMLDANHADFAQRDERIDTLVALAFAFDEPGAVNEINRQTKPESHESDNAEIAARLAVFDALSEKDRERIGRRLARLASLPAGEQAAWAQGVLRRGAEGSSRGARPVVRLDESVHPSHVARKLEGEPPHVRRLVMLRLPQSLAAVVVAALGEPPASGDEDRAALPVSEVVELVCAKFSEGFVSFAELSLPTALDRLAGAELRRLVRSLGVRETAIACRGIEAVEIVASFLRRFAAEDARAVASHIASLAEIDPERVRRAGSTIRFLLEAEGDTRAIVYRTGLRVLATDADWSDERRLGYAAQKLPAEAADELRELIRERSRDGSGSLRAAPGGEVETLAAKMVAARSDGLRSTASAFDAEGATL